MQLMDKVNTFEDRMYTVEQATNHKKKLKKGQNSSKLHNPDVQKVRDAILSSIDGAKSDFGAFENRKMRFLSSLDEDKDQLLFKQSKVQPFTLLSYNLEK